MEKINIYIHTNIHSVRSGATGFYIWVIEAITSKGPATLTDKEEITATWKEAELMALIAALKRLNKPCELTIHAGNVHLAAALNSGWLSKWSGNGYTNSKGEPIEFSDKWKELWELIQKHTFIAASIKANSYTYWMMSEIGEEVGKRQTQYSTSRKTLEDILKGVESLEITEVSENPELTNLVISLTEELFEKFEFLRGTQNTGFVKIENSESQCSTSREGDGITTDSVITVH